MNNVCDECNERFDTQEDLDEHRCPIYWTRPGMTFDAMHELFIEFIERVNMAGYEVLGYHFPPTRATMIVEVSFNLDRFGPAVRHDRRMEAHGDRN